MLIINVYFFKRKMHPEAKISKCKKFLIILLCQFGKVKKHGQNLLKFSNDFFVHLDGLFHLKTQIRRYVGSWLHFWTSRLSAVDTARPTLKNNFIVYRQFIYFLCSAGRDCGADDADLLEDGTASDSTTKVSIVSL